METVAVKVGKRHLAIIDAEDLPVVSQYLWYPRIAKGGIRVYAYTQLRRYEGGKLIVTNIHLHRLILNPPPGMDVDHKDRDGLNCCKSNLRIATRSQNNANRVLKGSHKTGYVGVVAMEHRSAFRGVVWCNNKQYNCGDYNDPISAARARDKKARELFGEFAVFNFPDLLDSAITEPRRVRPSAKPRPAKRALSTTLRAQWLLENQEIWKVSADPLSTANRVRSGLIDAGLLSRHSRLRDLNIGRWFAEAEKLSLERNPV